MAIDAEMDAAVGEAVSELKLGAPTAKRLVSWLKDMSDRELSATEEQQHLDALKSSIAKAMVEASNED